MKRIQELDGVRKKLRDRKEELQRKQERSVNVDELAQSVRECVVSWGTDLDGMSLESKRWMLRKIVSSITVDKNEGKAHITLRVIPTVDQAIEEAYEKMEKTKKAPEIQMPFRRTLVARARFNNDPTKLNPLLTTEYEEICRDFVCEFDVN